MWLLLGLYLIVLLSDCTVLHAIKLTVASNSFQLDVIYLKKITSEFNGPEVLRLLQGVPLTLDSDMHALRYEVIHNVLCGYILF